MPKPASRMMRETVIATDILRVRKSCSVLSSRSCQLEALVLKECFETAGQSRCAIRIAQFVYDHRRARRLLQESLRDPGMRINPG